MWITEPCVRKFEWLERSKRLGISQTKLIALAVILAIARLCVAFPTESQNENKTVTQKNFMNFVVVAIVFPLFLVTC